tara:strand:- start:469 stop:900 length:432 start_codon:yes stop_codon:yes gene_type:complete
MSNNENKLRPFHLAFPVTDLEKARKWYTDILGCSLGRESDKWIDFNMFGHQVVAHLVDDSDSIALNIVDGDNVPSRHFGVILNPDDWKILVKRLDRKGVDYLINPHTRFKGLPGEQSTLFITDPSGNALEFKSFASDDSIFSK